MTMLSYIWVIPLFPLAGFVINGLLGGRWGEKRISTVACTAVGLSFVSVLLALGEFVQIEPPLRYFSRPVYTWIETGPLSVDISFLVDPLSILMLLVITGVGLLIHIYSIGYMHGDEGFGRYFAYLNLFVFAMLLLVLADNFLLLFVGWEGVGLCSYLLIGFWFRDETNASAGRKAFVVNRVGDFGFLLAIFLIFTHFGTLSFGEIFPRATEVSGGAATAICLLLFVGATGKSAQVPLHVWLPDAMAGPTPVSALIHAATMVTAGVYMVARCHALFLQSEVAMTVVATIGIVTAFLAATIAVVQTDIKKVLAYSTISQLGYMFLACGVGAFGAGIFHLSTHAYFKALLFLGAGSVMHALSNETNMEKMGNLRRSLPVTYRVFLFGALALAGVPIFAGFFSKDEILWKTVNSPLGGFWYWLGGALIAGITAFYTFRMVYMTFFGQSRVESEVAKRIHESPPVMTVPLSILALLSVIGGFIGIPHLFNRIEQFLSPVFSRYIQIDFFEASHSLVKLEVSFMVISTLIALLGIGIAYLFYVVKPTISFDLSRKLKAPYVFLVNKWYIDDLYRASLVDPLHKLSDRLLWRIIDVKIIDGLVNGVAQGFRRAGQRLRRVESGVIPHYALSIAIGVIALLGYFIFG